MIYFSALVRVLILFIGIKTLINTGFDFSNNETFIGLGFVLVFVYFAIISKFGIDGVKCPMCKKGVCSIKK